MRQLKLLSYVMTVGGVALAAVAVAFDLSATIVLIGLMLAIAGGVKIAVVGIWHGVAGFGLPLNAETTAPSADARLKAREEERP